MEKDFCVDCKWCKGNHQKNGPYYWCLSPKREVSVVTGQLYDISCETARSDVRYCGPDGLWFERLYKR